MARPSRATEIDTVLMSRVTGHPKDLVRVAMAELGLSRPYVLSRVNALLESGHLLREGGRTRPSYRLGSHRRIVLERDLRDLEEHLVWVRDVAPMMSALPPNLQEICHYGFTEMVNNAIDHSEGRKLLVLVDVDPIRVQMVVDDDGVGIFRKIATHLELPDERLALLELAKGKLTTDPKRHSGEGVFFTSRMFDEFQILSGDLVFDHAQAEPHDLLFDVDDSRQGTAIFMEISTSSDRSMGNVFDQYSSGPDEYSFARTVVPVRLARVGEENLVSRSQAKRLLRRVDRFRTVMLDFDGIETIGQAFADEIFRVFANEHPDVELIPTRASTQVQQMIRRAATTRAENDDQGSLF